jgi:hypothetical protein
MNPMQIAAVLDVTLATDEPCFMCAWIEEDLRLHGKLTGHPLDSMNAGIFPVAGKQRHLELERMSLENR